MIEPKIAILLLPIAALLAGCDPSDVDGPPDPALVAEGQPLYEEPTPGGNTFACATCHALEDGDGRRRVGHPLGSATHRASFKNGRVETFEDAANSCLEEWMKADPWEDDDPRWDALRAYVDSRPGAEDEITFAIVSPPSDLLGGAPQAGRALFNDSCAECHGDDGVGTPRAIAVDEGRLEPSYIAHRVRTSGAPSPLYDGLTGGVMPFWAADRLSDDELRDLVAYLSRNLGTEPDPPDQPTPPDPPNPPDPPDEPSTCATTHPKVGQTAELQRFFHDVGGIAEIVDDCTIEIRDFDYDAQGIDVRIYAGVPDMYEDGFPISGDLVRDLPYNGEVLTLRLPEGRTMDEVQGVSVWCVDVSADFGSGAFD